MSKTSIEWTHGEGRVGRSWNPTLGCSKASPGCDNCYAISQSHRNTAMGAKAYTPTLTISTDAGTEWTGELRQLPDRLDHPGRWTKPSMVFVNSMSDLFHPDVHMDFIADVFAVMATCPQHTFQVLTKRPNRMARIVAVDTFQQVVYRRWFERTGATAPNSDTPWPGWPLPNVWLGTSIESADYNWRANHLRDTPAAVRFISAEPLLGPLVALADHDDLDLHGIDWVIAGGESGPGSRPMHPQWVRDLRDACVDTSCPECDARQGDGIDRSDDTPCTFCNGRPYGTAWFFKQWGQYRPGHPDDDRLRAVHFDGTITDIEPELNLTATGPHPTRRVTAKAHAGRELDGRTWDEFPHG